MLTYLFTASFKDNTQIKQDLKDQSVRNPEKNTYFDVLETIKEGNQLIHFSLDQIKIWNPTAIHVNLLTGIITVNNVDILPEVVPQTPLPLTLYWTMRVTQTMQMKHKGVTFLSKKVMPETRVYFLGWESGSTRHVIGVV